MSHGLAVSVGGTLAILFGFFGINASEVNPTSSMFDERYTPIYFIIVLIVGGALVLYFMLAWQHRRQNLRSTRNRSWRLEQDGLILAPD